MNVYPELVDAETLFCVAVRVKATEVPASVKSVLLTVRVRAELFKVSHVRVGLTDSVVVAVHRLFELKAGTVQV